MSSPKVTAAQFIDFLIATPSQARATEAQWTQPETADPAAHDAYTRLLHRLDPDSETLWIEVQPEVRRTSGVLVLDDSVLDKPCARKMDLVHHTCSGKHHRVVKGIDLLTLLWTDGDEPADRTGFYRNTASPFGDPFPTQRHHFRPPPATGFNCRQQRRHRSTCRSSAVSSPASTAARSSRGNGSSEN